MIEAELADGTILEFPDETPPEVMQRAVKKFIADGRRAVLGDTSSADAGPVGIPEPVTPDLELGAPLPKQAAPIDIPNLDLGFNLPGTDIEAGRVLFNAPLARTLAGGARNLGVGLARLPFDIADLAGIDNEIGERISRAVPTVATQPTQIDAFGLDTEVDLERAGQDILPFLAGGFGGARAGLAALPQAASKGRKFLAGLTGAAVGDAAVVDPSQTAGTVGDLIDAPTAIEPDDSPGVVRLKQAADAAVLGGAAAPVVSAAKGVGNLVNLIAKNFTRSGQEGIVGRVLNETVEDAGGTVQGALRQADETTGQTAGTTFQPTTAQATADPGITGLQRQTLSSDPRLARRAGEQDVAVSRQIEEATGPEGASVERRAQAETGQERLKAANVAEEQAAVQRVQQAGVAQQEATGKLKGVQETLADSRGSGFKEDASEALDETIQQEVRAGTAEKTEKFRAIDPEGKVEVPESAEALNEAAEEIVGELGRLSGREGIPADIIDDIKKLIPEKEAGEAAEEIAPLTFKELQDLRPRISDAIKAAQTAGNGRLAKNLEKIKDVVADEAQQLAKAGDEAGEAAQEAVRFFKEEFAPKFRTGEGEKFARAVKQDKNVPTKTAFKFIKPNEQGGRESAQQLKRILADAPNAEDATKQVRNFFVGKFVDQTGGVVSKEKVARFIARHSEALREFPEVRQEFFQLRNKFGEAEKAVNETDRLLKEATAGAKETSEKVKALATTRFFLERDPVAAIKKVMGSDNAPTEMRKLLRETRRDPTGEARKGVKAAINEWFQQTSRGKPTQDNFGQFFKAELDRVEDLLRAGSKNRAAIEQAFTKDELAALDRSRTLLRIQNRSTTGGRAGTEGLADAAAIADRARIFSAAMFGIIKGRAIFTLSKLGLKATGKDPVKSTMDLLREALLDPDLARTLMMRTDSQIAKKKLNAFLGSNIVAETGQDDTQ